MSEKRKKMLFKLYIGLNQDKTKRNMNKFIIRKI